MPNVKARAEDKLLELFLSVYEDRSWDGDLSRREVPERVKDNQVEIIATQIATRRTLAIEHTIIEPFVGEKKDFHENFQEFQRRLRGDDSLKEPGVSLDVEAPVNVLPKGANWAAIMDEVCDWLRAEKATFGVEKAILECPSPSHPNGKIALQVRRQPLERTKEAFVIVQRYGEMRISDSVEKALKGSGKKPGKLKKLVDTAVDRRILMLERDQGFLDPEAILEEVERLRSELPELQEVHEIWIADTATFGPPREWVEFVRRENGRHVESFAFYRGKLKSVGRNGMPVPMK